MHLGPLVHISWLQSIDDQDLTNENLDQLVDLIKEEGKLRMLRHQMNLQFLKAKRGNKTHSDFLYTLENLISVAEFKMMTSNDMIIHLFAEIADNTMSTLVLEILAGTKQTVTESRTKVTETENSMNNKIIMISSPWISPQMKNVHAGLGKPWDLSSS